MSRHSHWHNIKVTKGKADAKKAAKFTILARAITMAAKEKGGDPAMNPKLRTAIEKAREVSMPKDNIDRAVKKGTGELAAELIEELAYEGYGPGGAAVLVESLTDNRNRTVGNVKHLFAKHGGNLGASNSVAWMFERKGVIGIPKEILLGKDPDEVALEIVDWGASDVHVEKEGLTVFTTVEDFPKVKQAIERKMHYAPPDAGIEYVAKDPLPFDPAKHQGLEELLSSLEDDEDVKDVYTNVNL